MNLTVLSLLSAGTLLALVPSAPAGPGAHAGPSAAPAVHCQVPCGIYGDRMRIDMLMEDCATIEKGMKELQKMDAEEAPSKNQMVRWVMNKDQHAQAIQDQVAAYWLAQRVKSPKDPADDGATQRYTSQLVSMHQITVAAMKCKQTTDVAHVAALRKHALAFSGLYFSAEDLEHIHSHHGDH